MTTCQITKKKNDAPASCETASCETGAERQTVRPRADVWETDEAANVLVELPGVAQEDLELRLEDSRLGISAKSGAVHFEGSPVRTEWRPVNYARTFVLSRDADPEGIAATLKNGLLHIVVPKRADRRPRTIEIQVA